MAMNVGPAEGSDEDEVVSAINTTPLVDVMLVLLIIFLITIPVVTQTIAVQLPNERNIATQTKPENVVIAVDSNANIYWNTSPVDANELLTKLKEVSVMVPQPEVHIRGDQHGDYEGVGKVVVACQRAGIVKIGFITEPVNQGG
jgi:biopolymer transport protein ExbD